MLAPKRAFGKYDKLYPFGFGWTYLQLMKHQKGLTLFAAFLILLASVVPISPAIASTCTVTSFASGAGTSANPYIISNDTHFRNIRFCDGTTAYFSVRSDIDLQNVDFVPFGSSSEFKSTITGEVLDGGATRSARITGLSVSNRSYAGLITNGGSGTVLRNLYIEGSVTGTFYAAGLIARGLYLDGLGTIVIERVTTAIDVKISGNSSSTKAAGFLGFFGKGDNTFPAGTLTISASHAIFSSGKGTVVGNANTSDMGGLVAAGRGAQKIIITRSSAQNIVSVNDPDNVYVGGLVGGSYNVGIEVLESKSSATIQQLNPVNNTGSASYLGGLIGYPPSVDGTLSIKESVFDGLISFRGKAYVGGLIAGTAPTGTTTLYDSYSTGYISYDSRFGTAPSNAIVGGLVGFAGVEIDDRRLFSNTKIEVGGSAKSGSVFGFLNVAQSMTNVFYNNQIDGTSVSAIAGDLNGKAATGATALTTAGMATESNFVNFGANEWEFGCHQPYLDWEASEGCQPRIAGARIAPSGEALEVFFTTAVNPVPGSGNRYPDSSLFTVTKNSNPLTLSAIVSGPSLRSISIPISEIIANSDQVAFSYTHPNPGTNLPQDQALEAQYGSQEDVRSRTVVLSVNASTAGPSATFGSASVSPSTIEIPLTCTANCGAGDSYSYVVSITPNGGATSTISGEATSSQTNLSFTNLNANISHTIQASVAYQGIQSSTTSTIVATPKPIATISAVVVSETSATLTVGCTNCGASPTSYTVSARPITAGATISSNTNVITGLVAETSYSFSVVVAFAGTTSDSVNWRSNPQRTLPYAPTITSIAPTSGPLSGASITVTGTNFGTSSEVRIGSTTVSFSVLSSTTITFTAPASTAGQRDIQITNQVGTATLTGAFTYVAPPTLASISPVLVTVNGGTIVTLVGTNLNNATSVNLGSLTVSPETVSSTKIRFTTPARTAGLLDIGVTTPGGTATLSSAIEFTSSALTPIVFSISPTSGPAAGGTSVTVTGKNFSGNYSQSVSAAINGVTGSAVVVIDDSTLTFTSPAHVAAASLDISVTTGAGTGTLASAFSYLAVAESSGGSSRAMSPEIIKFSTRTLSTKGGTVTVYGVRLGGLVEMKLGASTVSISNNSDNSVTFIASELPEGTWDLYFAGPYGQYTYQAAITVASTTEENNSFGKFLGFKWTLKFTGNSRSLSPKQIGTLRVLPDAFKESKTLVCWGYTTAKNPNSWAIAHATKRAESACSVVGKQINAKTVVRIRYGVAKSQAMRSAIQFWK